MSHIHLLKLFNKVRLLNDCSRRTIKLHVQNTREVNLYPQSCEFKQEFQLNTSSRRAQVPQQNKTCWLWEKLIKVSLSQTQKANIQVLNPYFLNLPMLNLGSLLDCFSLKCVESLPLSCELFSQPSLPLFNDISWDLDCMNSPPTTWFEPKGHAYL